MSNTQSQLKWVIQSVNKLTSALKSAQRNNKKLADSIRQNRDELKQLNQTCKAVKPYSAPEHAQETAHDSNKKEESRDGSRYSRIKDLRDRISQHGANAKSAGVKILTTSKNFLMPGYDLNAQMAKIQVQTNIEKNSPEYAMLLNQSRELSKSTGIDASKIAQGQSLYASAGYSPDQIKNMMPGTVSMSQASGADFVATIDIGTNVLEGFKLQSEEMSRVSDVLTATFTGSKTTLAALDDTMKFVAPTVPALNVLVDQAGQGGLQAFITKLKNVQGESQKVASAMTNSLTGDIQKLNAAWNDLGVQMFSGVEGSLRRATQKVTNVVNKVGEWMEANPRLAATLATITMVIGGMLTVFGALAQAIASILLPLAVAKYSLTFFGSAGVRALGFVGNALKMLGSTMMIVGRLMMANPILAIIGLISMAAVYIWQNWETLGPKFSQLWESIKISISDKWNEIITGIMSLPDKFKEFGTAIVNSLLDGINEKWEALKKKLTSLSDYIPEWMRPWDDASKGVSNNISPNVSSVLSKHDKGGIIPAGKFGIVGEYGPEIVSGPVNVISRLQTAKLAAVAAFSLSVMAPSTAARTAPLHIQSLPIHAYPQIQEKVDKKQIQYRNESPVYHINIYGAPGQSAQDIAAAVRRELDDRERKQQARLRSSYSDRGEF
ncbi:phage tail tape measure protein [Photorhabdus thracensis]|uniref:phage tail tape measure protein n=1 Tax=Photorhabdus thracensis TaxID=230089 RepID=UPI001E4D0558|nr:phage tail tape measure protein [Photorhabdus thracensis]